MRILSQNPDIPDACTIGNIKPEVEDKRTVRQWGERVDTVITDQLANRHCNFYQGLNTWLYLLWAGRKRPCTGKIIHVVILRNADTYLACPEVFDCELHKFEEIVGLLETLHSADPVLRLGGRVDAQDYAARMRQSLPFATTDSWIQNRCIRSNRW